MTAKVTLLYSTFHRQRSEGFVNSNVIRRILKFLINHIEKNFSVVYNYRVLWIVSGE